MKKENILISNLINILLEEYGIEVSKIKKNDESTDGNVYMIDSIDNKYVLKLYDNIAHTESMVKLHNFLINSGLKVPAIITSNDNQLYKEYKKNRFVVIYSFMEGEHLTWDKKQGQLGIELIREIAAEVRRLHALTENNNEFRLPKLPFGKEVERNSVLHFDLTKHNIFNKKSTNNSIGFIDFDDAKYGASVCDLAIVVSILFFSKTNGANSKEANEFIDEYYGDDIELKEKEKTLIKEFALLWIEYLLEGNEFDTSTTESFEVRKSLIENYLNFENF